jgi:hypothetical protein
MPMAAGRKTAQNALGSVATRENQTGVVALT